MCAAQADLLGWQVQRVRGITSFFLLVLGSWLLGYAYLGRGFAYIGIPPFYIDSVLLAVTGLCLLLQPRWLRSAKDPSVLLLLLFMAWGAARTLPEVKIYGIDALRDSVLWSYGVVALLLGYLTWRTPLETRVTNWYARWMAWLPLWAPVAFLLYWLYEEALPRFPWGPGGGVPVVNPKGGDVAVHLAGGLAYWLLVQPYWRTAGVQIRLFWLGWSASFAFVAFTSRAALLTVAFVAFVLVLHVSPVRWVWVAALMAGSVLVAGLLDVEVGMSRISVDQLVANVASIFTEVEGFSGEGSKRWRLMWWSEIVNYTVLGPYFWTGKGFGINLADSDGFQVFSDGSLRSPHNGHLTVLARSGVPGFSLWTLFFALLMGRLWLSYWRWCSRGERFQGSLCLWTFSYLLAGIINAAFDVYLEGPQGGIWFWSIVGFGIGLLLKERNFMPSKSSRNMYPMSAARRSERRFSEGQRALPGNWRPDAAV